MATYSTSLQIKLITDGTESGTWGSSTNTNWNLMEQAVAGVQSITMINADYTLSVVNGASDEARNAVLVVGGTNSAIRKIVAPLVPKVYIVFNNTVGGYAITIGGSTGAVATIPTATTCIVYCDGTNFYSGTSGSPGNFSVAGNETVAGTLSVTGATSLTTGSISGVMTAPTAALGTNTTQIATTAFALANGLPSGAIILWSGSVGSIPSGYYLCNGANGTPDLRDRFIVGAGSTYAVGGTGGSADAIVVSHTHTATSSVTDPGHNHTVYATINNGSSGAFGGGMASPPTTLTTSTSTTGITVATSVSTAGTSGTGANLPPYYALCYIMKA